MEVYQTLSWFVPLFEKNSLILHNFKTFLEACEEGFREQDKMSCMYTCKPKSTYMIRIIVDKSSLIL